MTKVYINKNAKESFEYCKKHSYIITALLYVLLIIMFIVFFALLLLNFNIAAIIDFCISYICFYILNTGYSWWSLSAARGNENLGEFKTAFKHTIPLIVIGLKSFLYMATCNYGVIMAPFCYRDNMNLGSNYAIRESIRIMNGYKMDYVMLKHSFFMYELLTIFTLGIGGIFTLPYIRITKAAYYDCIKNGNTAIY